MSVVRYIPYTNRLAKLIKTPGGKSVEEAMTQADANLATIRPPCLEELDALLAQVRQLSEGAPDGEAYDQIYLASNDIVGLGGVFSLNDLSSAAYSLCELIDRTRERGGPTREALLVHVESLRLLRQGDVMDAAARRSILDGLASVVRRTTTAQAV